MDISQLDFIEIKKKLESLDNDTIINRIDRIFRYLALKRVEVNQIEQVIAVLKELGIPLHDPFLSFNLQDLYKTYRKKY